jgi:hypothetical protein
LPEPQSGGNGVKIGQAASGTGHHLLPQVHEGGAGDAREEAPMANPSTNPSGSGRLDQSRRALICSRGDTTPLDAEAMHRGCRNT